MQRSRTLNMVLPAIASSALLLSVIGASATTAVAAKPRPTRTPRPTSPPQPTPTPTAVPGLVCWTVAAVPNIPGYDTTLNSVHGSGPNDVWAVGYSTENNTRHTLTLHWDGSNWSVIPSPNPEPDGNNTINQLNGVYAIAANDAWAVGYTVGESQGYRTLSLHWNGATWQTVPSPNLPITRPDIYNALSAVSAVAANDVWAVGGAFTGIGAPSRAVLMHWDGATWSLTPEPPETALWSSTGRTGVTAVAPNDVWAVGQFSAFRWNGSAWTVPVGFSGQSLLGVDHSSANNVWAVGTIPPSGGGSEGGGSGPVATSYRFDGTSWTFTTPELSFTGNNTSFKGVTVIAPNNVWAVGSLNRSTMTQQWDGAAWRIVRSADGNPNPDPNSVIGNVLNSVHANSATDIWAVGFFYDAAFQPRALIERYVCQ